MELPKNDPEWYKLRDEMAREYHAQTVLTSHKEDFNAGFNARHALAERERSQRGCSVELSCKGGIFDCMKNELTKERDTANAKIAELEAAIYKQELAMASVVEQRDRLNEIRSELEAERDRLRLDLSGYVKDIDWNEWRKRIRQRIRRRQE